MATAKILAFAGSTRSGSFNQTLLDTAVNMVRDTGAQVTSIKLKDYPLPLFDQDLEAAHGLPTEAVELKELFVQHSALLIACPEYNSSITPLLKNVIDWVSRPADENDSPLSAYKGKTAALIAASPGGFGGLRGLRHVREILSNINVLVSPGLFALAKAHESFNESGAFQDERQAAMLKSCIDQFVGIASNQVSE